MDFRPPLGIQRPLPPQRAVSVPHALQHGLKRPAVPSRLHNVRSVSQPVNVVDLTSEASLQPVARNTTAFLGNGGDGSIYASPGVVVLDDDNGRPAKRARTGEQALKPPGQAVGADQDSAHRRLPGKPLPLPPHRTSMPLQSNTRSQKSVDRLARKANGLEPPSMATRLPPPKQVADFAPWNGQHPEDVLTETVIKGGYYDKPPGVNSAESNSAKPAIWPNLSAKNNMGLQTLSYLFSSIMEKRQAIGKCTAPSTFKPPPRVTVTDTKREAWLRDLANTDVPLRKQSRTIPHGIRGKLLLEQCLSKNIPMPRAMWLAKCVGANELRAFRRKGSVAANGEAKWIREWTISVEQFLEAVITTCGQPGWQPKMDYAVRLATSLYSEQLLEREHYLDWMVHCFSQTTLDRLPIWIILVQLYWNDVVSLTRRGRKLAESLLESLHRLTQESLNVHGTLKNRLQKLVTILAIAHRGCLIVPNTWQKYSYLLAPRTTAPTSPAHNIARRNSRLAKLLLKTPHNTKCKLLRLFMLLDSVQLSPDLEGLATACQSTVPDIDQLIHALLDWSASVFRAGNWRIYLTARIITYLHDRGQDTDRAILDYLRASTSPAIIASSVHRVIAELTRVGHFSPGRYMQWLITSGALSGNGTSELSSGLLTALPADALPSHLSNTRSSLLRRLGKYRDEQAIASNIESALKSSNTMSVETARNIDALSISGQSNLGKNISLGLTKMAKSKELSMHHFCMFREVLERVQDLNSLSEGLHAALHLDDSAVLTAIADTISLNARTFAAIDSLRSLVDQISERYRTVRTQQSLDRALLVALLRLCKHVARCGPMRRLLENDLSVCEQQTYMAVCSPASDNLVSMRASALDSDDDIDAVFASGNTMDDQLMQRVFHRIVQRASKTSEDVSDSCTKLCGWFSQLRALDTSIFEQLARSYARASLATAENSIAPFRAISALVASDCMAMSMILDLAKDVGTPSAAWFAVRLLMSPPNGHAGLTIAQAYRFRVIQKTHQSDPECREKAFPLFAAAMQDAQLPAEDDDLLEVMLQYSVLDAEAFKQALSRTLTTTTLLSNCARVVKKMIGRGRGIPVEEVKLDASTIVSLATPLSVTHCTGALAFMAKAQAAQGGNGAPAQQAAILEAIISGSEVWPQLLEGARQDTVQGIYRWAKSQILDQDLLDEDGADPEAVMRNLDILGVAYHAARDDTASVIGTIAEKLRALLNLLPTRDSDGQHSSRVMMMLQVLLSLSILYCMGDASKQTESQSGRANILAVLCLLLGHSGLQRHQELLEYVHDVASALGDTLPEEALATLAQNMHRSGHRDLRLAPILGNINTSTDAWLALVSQPQPQGSQQHRALLAKQAAAAAGQQPHAMARQPSTQPLLGTGKGPVRPLTETKIVPFPLRRWEIMSDATPTVGDNDTSLSLSLFGARKVS